MRNGRNVSKRDIRARWYITMTIQEIRALTNLSQPQFCEKYHIPLPTLRKWEQGKREPPDYLVELLAFKVREDLKNEF